LFPKGVSRYANSVLAGAAGSSTKVMVSEVGVKTGPCETVTAL